MKYKPFDLLSPLSVKDTLIKLPELPKSMTESQAPEGMDSEVFEKATDAFVEVIGAEPHPTVVSLPTLVSHEVMQDAPSMYKPEPSPTSILDVAMALVEENEKAVTVPAGTTAEDIPLVAVKFDAGKTDWSLLPIQATEEIIKVLEFGAAKYDKNNWAKGNGFRWTRPFNAMLRHLFAWVRGEDNDPESGISHIAHVGCNVLFLLTFILNKDRYSQDDRNV